MAQQKQRFDQLHPAQMVLPRREAFAQEIHRGHARRQPGVIACDHNIQRLRDLSNSARTNQNEKAIYRRISSASLQMEKRKDRCSPRPKRFRNLSTNDAKHDRRPRPELVLFLLVSDRHWKRAEEPTRAQHGIHEQRGKKKAKKIQKKPPRSYNNFASS
jgi:hypothetical protein